MKENVIKSLFLYLTFPLLLNCQITTTKVTAQTEIPKVKYDSTKNFLEKDEIYGYIGQELYLKPLNKDLRDYGYRGFSIEYPSIYNNNYNYSKIADKYFIVEKIEKAKFGFDYFVLTLKEKSKGEKYYYVSDHSYDFNFPFLAVGYVDKLKRNNVGKQFIVRGETRLKDGPVTDINTGKILNFENGSVWKCNDITLDSEYFTLCILLVNDKNESVLVTAECLNNPDVLIKSEYGNKLKQKYGAALWNSAINKKVKLGMPRELCLIAWGKPSLINKTVTEGRTVEQYVYGTNSYLYFTDGILTAVQ